MNPSGNLNLATQAYASGNANQAALNNQSTQLQGQYGADVNQANSAYSNLQNYNNTMQSPSQMYGQDLTNAQQMYGFDPTQLLKANQALANTNTTMANLPQAIQQQGNYYGTTAGQTAGNYANQAGNLQGVEAGQSNTVNAYQNILAATQNQANQQATLGFQGQQLSSQNLQALYSGAVSQMQTAGTTMSSIEQLAQQQGYVTAEQTTAYQNAYSQYMTAQAAQQQAAAATTAAGAQVTTANANAAQVNQQVQQLTAIQNAFKQIYGNNWAEAVAQLTGSGNVTEPTVNGSSSGLNLGSGSMQGASGSSGLQ